MLRAADLRTFEEVAGEGALRVEHPAELVLGLRRADLLTAGDFSAGVALAVAERALAEGEGSPGVERPEPGRRLGPA